jgi:cytochrome c
MIRVSQLLGLTLVGSTILALSHNANSAPSKKGSAPYSSPAAVEIGRSDFDNNCGACHPIAAGQNGYGPGLFGVVGRRSGTASRYAYSPSYVEAGAKGITWTESNLFQFLADPRAFLTQKIGHPADTRMIGGFPNEGLRKGVIGYLKTLK